MVITLKVSDKTKKQMDEYYEDLKRPKTPQYATFQADDFETVVTLYDSGKAVFQGKDADIASEFWIETEKINSGHAIVTNSDNKKKEKKELVNSVKDDNNKYMTATTIGSDEVGTGDYFGPIVVTSSYVKKEDIEFLKELGVMDSKKITDDKILKIAPLISKRITYCSLVLNNKDYNKYHKNEYNMNKVKAIMHNKVLLQLVNELTEKFDYIVVDEFAKEHKYYEYLKDTPHIQRGITFLTKAEDKCLSVACSSIISRFLFLKEFDKLSDSLHIPLPKGAGVDVDKVGREIARKYGKDKLNEVAKTSFKNTERILN